MAAGTPLPGRRKTVGVIGGIGPESTIDYYRALIAEYRDTSGDSAYPSIVVNSIDLTRLLDSVTSGDLDGLTDYLLAELQRLADAGADFALLASNTPHLVFDRLLARTPVPLISIVETACRAAQGLGVRRAALFGTRFTMEAGFYDKVFARAGVLIVVPGADERAFIHEKYLEELVVGVFRPETREALLAIAHRLRREEHADALVLGGTELPLLLRGLEVPGLPFIDTARLHVKAAVARLVDPSDSGHVGAAASA
jgi:aspartate racemase